ncbi:hypothetical protein [Aureliella helgolandensis]|uniref:SWIM-type domain-containing protein n=1 Tax=Aureliella helgolandensis TaxID=2527968 RepID=A0A518G4I6_9BACT|nr:hypothetical protein [Aureliella helgolandensis]QDV23449.1 hypothetical protein Q31a_17470 [Aureliella helgolandensis]
MNTDYTHEYLTLIEEVAEDGELTHREIVRLAKWLNDNMDGRKTWPASQFLPLLKDVFADGKIDEAEAIQVGRLIQKVRREWAREHALSGVKPFGVKLDDAIGCFDDGAPRLIAIPTKLQVASFREPDLTYDLDLTAPSCSCPDFQSYRQHLPVGHISRCCKHIMQGYAEIRPSSGWPSWLEPFLEAGFRPHPEQEWCVVEVSTCNYLVSSASPEWGNVYARIDGVSEKYGFSIDEHRWSYGKEPAEPASLANAIRRLSTR